MIPLAIGVTSVCVGRWIYKKTSSCPCPNQELNVEENQTKQQAWNFKKGILSTAISKICLDIYDGNPVNITELIQPNRIEFCNRQLFIEEPNSLQHVASIYFIDSKKTIIISCIGSKTFKDWLSNFTHFNSTNNEKNVPDFIWDSALDIYNNFNQHCKQKNISD